MPFPLFLKKHLHVKISLYLALGTILVAGIFTLIFYGYTYNQEMRRGMKTATQFLDTLERTAAIAAYLNEYELGREVVDGIARHDFVARVTLVTSDGGVITSGKEEQMLPDMASHAVSHTLHSPFSSKKVGTLCLVPDTELLSSQARKIAIGNAIALGALAILGAYLSQVLIRVNLTLPIENIASQLHGIIPGKDDRLKCPDGQQKNEIGSLVADTNQLLDLTCETIKKERKMAEEMLSLEVKYQRIFEQTHAAFFVFNPQGRLLVHNRSFERFFSFLFSQDRACEKNTKSIVIYDYFTDKSLASLFTRHNTNNSLIVERDLQVQVPDNFPETWLHCIFTLTQEWGKSVSVIEGVAFDISTRRRAEQKANYQAEHDQLTGLLNRRGAEQILKDLLPKAKVYGSFPVVYLLDLDGFKVINDTLGHDAGDQVLVEIARRLQFNCRSTDRIIRWGGDEFMIVVLQGNDTEGIITFARKLVEELSRPIILADCTKRSVGVSIGVAGYSSSMSEVDELISKADQAMYKVKQSGKRGFCFYDPENGFSTERIIDLSG